MPVFMNDLGATRIIDTIRKGTRNCRKIEKKNTILTEKRKNV